VKVTGSITHYLEGEQQDEKKGWLIGFDASLS
jgi:hypothetical protein